MLSASSFLRRARYAAKLLRQRKDGMAMVEFALLAPFLLLTFVSLADLGLMILTVQKTGRASGTLADLTAQSDVGATETQISDLLRSSRFIVRPANLDTDARIFISAVVGGPAGVGNTILWQRCIGGLTSEKSSIATSNNRNVVLPNNIVMGANEIAIIAEAAVQYRPVFLNQAFPDKVIREISLARPRTIGFSTLTPDGSTPLSDCGSNTTAQF